MTTSPSPSLPRRVWVVGPSGSGKSTLAAALAAALGVTPTHLDDLYWRPGWTVCPPAEFAALVGEVVARPVWVVDGNYRTVQPQFLRHADLVVWLDMPLSVTLRRVAARTVARLRTGVVCCNGNRETWAATLCSRDSILRWALTSHRPTRRRYARMLSAYPHVRLRHPREVRRWQRAAVATARRG